MNPEPATGATGEVAGGERVVVLGLGNVLVGDDGAGVAALADLTRRYLLPPQVEVFDGGVLGLQLLGLVEDVEHLLVLDAVRRVGAVAGDVVRLDGDQVRARFAVTVSTHELGLAEVVGAAELRGRRPRHLVVLGVHPGAVQELTLALTPPVEATVGVLADLAAAELRTWGLAVSARTDPEPARPYPDGVLPAPASSAPGGRDA